MLSKSCGFFLSHGSIHLRSFLGVGEQNILQLGIATLEESSDLAQEFIKFLNVTICDYNSIFLESFVSFNLKEELNI